MTTNETSTTKRDPLLALERAQALARAIRRELGDQHAALFAMLDRELHDVEHILEAESASENGVHAADDDDESPLERARDDAQRATYEIRDLLEAAIEITHDGGNAPAHAVLLATRARLVKLTGDLDVVHFGAEVSHG